MSALSDLSRALADAAEKAGQSVVRVEGRRRMPASGILWSADGLVATAQHVLERDEEIHVGLPGGDRREATLVGRDPTTDIAVLRVSGASPAAHQQNSADLRPGQIVLALGRPGNSVMSTLGVISSVGEAWRTPAGGKVDRYLQTDVLMYPGFSGGPAINAEGEVIGLNTSGLLRGVSLSLPAETVDRIVKTIVQHGRVRRGYLGVAGHAVRLPEATRKELAQESGVLIASVESESPASEGGLLLGDVILRLGGDKVEHLDDLISSLGPDRVGEQVAVDVLRGGRRESVRIRVGERG